MHDPHDTTWYDDARCRGRDPREFDIPDGAREHELGAYAPVWRTAIEQCSCCPVASECAADVLETPYPGTLRIIPLKPKQTYSNTVDPRRLEQLRRVAEGESSPAAEIARVLPTRALKEDLVARRVEPAREAGCTVDGAPLPGRAAGATRGGARRGGGARG